MTEDHPIPTDPRFINLIDKPPFGFLTVKSYAGRSSAGKHRWRCVCACGAVIVVQGTNLKNGHQRSCGCRTSELLSEANRASADQRAAELIAERNSEDGRILLNNGMTCRIDPEDFPLVSPHVWHHHTGGGGHYARATVNGRLVLMHVLLMGERDGFVIDHRDRDGLNNRRENLRWASSSGNATNSTRRNGRSGYRGVNRTRAGRWAASITAGNRREWLGTFDTAEEAARIYDAAAVRLHGEFAAINFPGSAASRNNDS